MTVTRAQRFAVLELGFRGRARRRAIGVRNVTPLLKLEERGLAYRGPGPDPYWQLTRAGRELRDRLEEET